MWIQVPFEQLGTGPYAEGNQPLTGNRTQRFTYTLVNNDGESKGELLGVTGGQLEWNQNATIKSGGKITVQSGDRKHDWLTRRIKIIMHIDGVATFPLGVFIPSVPSERWDDSGLSLDIDLYDKCVILDSDYVVDTYSVPQGTRITDEVKKIIRSTGESAGSIETSDVTLSKDMTWESGTSKLAIINDLLDAGNFFSLSVDGAGVFVAEEYRLPRLRPIIYHFIDNKKGIYRPDFTYEKDEFTIPNKVVMITDGDDDSEADVAIATNENPNSPYSYQKRGRWISDVTKGVEATDHATLEAKAQRRLAELTDPSGAVTIDHAPLPALVNNAVVTFRHSGSDIDIRGVVQSTQISLDPTALQHTEIRETAEL